MKKFELRGTMCSYIEWADTRDDAVTIAHYMAYKYDTTVFIYENGNLISTIH